MTWFWMNHFSVFSGKANVRWTIADYEEQAIRPHALGRFRDLVMATVTSPAMLEYLDNAQSAAGHINENYARELMELHTLGVSGGPSGRATHSRTCRSWPASSPAPASTSPAQPPRLDPKLQPLYVARGRSSSTRRATTPARRRSSARRFQASGLDESRGGGRRCSAASPQPRASSARKLATYFVADEPPPATRRSHGRARFSRPTVDIAAVLKTMFLDREVARDARARRRRPARNSRIRWSSSSRRCVSPTKARCSPTITRSSAGCSSSASRSTAGSRRTATRSTEAAWTSSGQIVQRFEIARAIGSGNAGLFNNEDNTPGPTVGFPMLDSRFFYERIEPALSRERARRSARPTSQQEWNTMLLASPDWMQR